MKRRTYLICRILCFSLLLTGLLQPFAAAGPSFMLFSRAAVVVPDRISWDDINAIPVASPDMTEDELRQICVDFMVLQQSFTWTPSQNLDYSCPAAGAADENGLLHCYEGYVYGGLPYGNGGLSLYNAMTYYDPETGVLDAYATQSDTTLALTNNCSSAVVWALARVCTSLKSFSGTVAMTQKNGYLPVGPYTYDADLARYNISDDTRTKKICEANGQEVMFESYALMKKADGMVVYTQSAGGHTRMARYDATVVRNTDGTINGEKSYVIAVEQFSSKKERLSGGQTVYQHGELDKKYSFNALYKSGYLPFTIAEFTGEKAVERAQVSINTTASGLSFSSLRNKSINTNYNLAAVTLTVRASDGTLKDRFTKHVPVSKLYSSFSLKDLIPADYKISGHAVIEAVVSSGETITVYEDDFCYNEKGSFYGNHFYNSATVTVSTCTNGGYTTYTCSRCGDTCVSDETAAKGHSWSEAEYAWSEGFGTCTAKRSCQRCDEEETETVIPEIKDHLAIATFSNPAFAPQQLSTRIWGDANGDGAVSNKDIVRLKNYLANFDQVTEESTYEIFPGADANGDGVVSNKDIVRLKNYLADFDDLTGESTVVLGPQVSLN